LGTSSVPHPPPTASPPPSLHDALPISHLTVALGGHPPPLILRRDGGVDSVGEPGTLLGALPSPILADSDASLAVGDSLILYTDGDRKSTRLNSSHLGISYAVFCLKKKT